jgi:hypothetical protein
MYIGAGTPVLADDLVNVDWIGLYLTTPGDSSYVFGVDNWEYYSSAVPEPASMLFAVSALLSVALMRRRMERETVAG